MFSSYCLNSWLLTIFNKMKGYMLFLLKNISKVLYLLQPYKTTRGRGKKKKKKSTPTIKEWTKCFQLETNKGEGAGRKNKCLIYFPIKWRARWLAPFTLEFSSSTSSLRWCRALFCLHFAESIHSEQCSNKLTDWWDVIIQQCLNKLRK